MHNADRFGTCLTIVNNQRVCVGNGMGIKVCPPNHVWCENEFHPSPGGVSTTTSTVSLELYIVASGSVNDYTEAVLKDLRKKNANMLAIKKKLVTVTVGAGSVIITATIAVPAATAAAVQATVSSNLGTAAAASTALGITVEAAPTITTTGASGCVNKLCLKTKPHKTCKCTKIQTKGKTAKKCAKKKYKKKCSLLCGTCTTG